MKKTICFSLRTNIVKGQNDIWAKKLFCSLGEVGGAGRVAPQSPQSAA